MASRVSRGIALPFLGRGIRRGWVVNSTPQPHFTPGKDPVPIVQEAGWAPGPVWKGGKSRLTGIRSPDRPARSQSLYRLSYLALLYAVDISIFLSAVLMLQEVTLVTWLHEQGPSWKTNNPSTDQVIPLILRRMVFHYTFSRVCKIAKSDC
jgi:hypothetical protein